MMIPSVSVCCSSCIPAAVSSIAVGLALRDIEKKSRRTLPSSTRIDSKHNTDAIDVYFEDSLVRHTTPDEPQPEPQSALTPNPSHVDIQQVFDVARPLPASEGELERLREKVSQLQAELVNANRTKSAVITQKNNELAALQKQATSAQCELDEMRGASVRFQEESRRLEGDVSHLKDSMSKMRDADHQKDLQLNQKSYELRRTFLEIARKDNELSKKMAEITQQDDLLTALRSIVASAERELNGMCGPDPDNLAKECNHLKDSLSRLREDHRELCEERAQLEGRLEELTRENEDLREQLEEMGNFEVTGAPAVVEWQSLEHRIDEIHAALAEAQRELLKKRHNQSTQDLNGAIQVYVRVRPVAKREVVGEVVVRKVDTFQLEVDNKGLMTLQKGTRRFKFDSIFDECATQEDVFAECRNLVFSVIDGYNVTVFAYGQTGAGKTHTMYGSQAAPGLVPNLAEELFTALHACAQDYQATVRCSMLELYCDDLFDLLLPTRREQVKLEIKKDVGGSVHVCGISERIVASQAELLKAIQYGQNKRHVASTNMNAHSSRSHLIFTIKVDCLNKKTKSLTIGKLTLCDLAGSERLKKSQATGDALKEAQSTNKSLSALLDVIEASSNNAPHIPYRNHKLTQLLSDSIGGTAKTLLFVNCSPVLDDVDETVSSLGFAARAKFIVNKIEKHHVATELTRLKRVIQELEQFKKHGAPERGLTPGVPMQNNLASKLRPVL